MSRVGGMHGPEAGEGRPAGGFLAGAAALLRLRNLFGRRPETFVEMPAPAAAQREISERAVAAEILSGKPDAAPVVHKEAPDDRPGRNEEIERLVAHVAGARSPGRARRILVTRAPGEGSPDGGDCAAFASLMARECALEGRTILVLFGDDGGGRPGLSELIDGSASFSEAIHREVGSRLHLLPPGCGRSAPGRGLDVVLEALSDTYDFVVVAAAGEAEALRRLSVALAQRMDHVFIGCGGQTGSPDMVAFRDALKAEGAGEVVAARFGAPQALSREAA